MRKPKSKLAVAGVICSVLGNFTIFLPLFFAGRCRQDSLFRDDLDLFIFLSMVFCPLIGIVCCLKAKMYIVEANGELAGDALANTGIVLGLLSFMMAFGLMV